MADKRIIELANEKLVLADGDMTIVDSENGTYKYDLNRLAKKTITDTTLSVEGKPADAKAVGDALASVDVDTVNNARQLLSESYVLDEEPYLFRASGGEGADRVEECIVGGSVAWNQLAIKANYTASAYGMSLNADSSTGEIHITGTANSSRNAEWGRSNFDVLIQEGHKYFLCGATPKVKMRLQGAYAYATYNSPIIRNAGSGTVTDIVVNMEVSEGEVINETLKPQIIDLTTLFGSTIADYIYSLETATAGAGVAWFRKYFPADFYEYSAPTLKHVEGVSAKQIKDADDNVTAIYPLDSSLTLRGIPKLTDGKMWFDGDRYNADGTVKRNTILRAYQSGDESLANAITDGTNTVVYSANVSSETATPYTALQTLDPHGTEEFVSTGIVPVGHESHYLENLRSKIEGLPKDFSTLIAPTEKAYKATQNYTVGSLLIVDNILYKVTSAIANGGTITPNTNVTATTLSAVIAAL